ncbi:MAG: hypothetical protein M0004_14890 [Actinomycetota bacterium]|nr:hypothetical protein [Actinomycetota bacterium]
MVVTGALVVAPPVLVGGRTTDGEPPPHALATSASNPASPSALAPRAAGPEHGRPRLAIATFVPTASSMSGIRRHN